MEGRATGTTVIGIRQSELRKIQILLPPKSLVDEFSKLGDCFLQSVETNSMQNNQLEALRDYLLPKLISGELRLPDAQHQAKIVIA